MGIRGILLSVLAVAAAIHVSYVWLESPSSASVAGVVALAALAGYVAAAGRSVAQVTRWALLAGILALMLVVGADAIWPHESTVDVSAFQYGAPERILGTMRDANERWLGRQRWMAAGLLLAAICLAVSLFVLPRRRRPWLALSAVAVAIQLACLVLVDAWDVLDADDDRRSLGGRLLDIAGAGVLPLLAALVLLGAAVIAAQRAGIGWLTAAGATILAVPALVMTRDMVASLPTSWLAGPERTSAFLSPGNTAAPMLAMNLPSDSAAAVLQVTELEPAALAAALLLGVALIVIGCLRPEPTAPPAEPAAPPPA